MGDASQDPPEQVGEVAVDSIGMQSTRSNWTGFVVTIAVETSTFRFVDHELQHPLRTKRSDLTRRSP